MLIVAADGVCRAVPIKIAYEDGSDLISGSAMVLVHDRKGGPWTAEVVKSSDKGDDKWVLNRDNGAANGATHGNEQRMQRNMSLNGPPNDSTKTSLEDGWDSTELAETAACAICHTRRPLISLQVRAQEGSIEGCLSLSVCRDPDHEDDLVI